VLLLAKMPGKVVPLAPARSGAAPSERAELSDEDLMLLVRAGSREAMATLAERHVRRLTGFCVKLTGDAAAGEDIVQEVLLRLWTRRAEWQPRGRFVALLYTAARNLCRNRARDLRRRGRWLLPEGADLEAGRLHAKDGDVEAMLARERRRDAQRALGELSEAMREAVILRFDLEMSYEAIATIVGASESTVRSRVHYGLLRLRALVKEGDER
jgi:RNA polymerase sigma-70 factor (ECF subfamily)